MAIRKTIASGLVAAAVYLQKDQTKEKINKQINNQRKRIAKWIEPK